MELQRKTDKSTTAPDQPTKDLFKQAQELYDEAIRSQKEGDWARYGETIKRLGEILKRDNIHIKKIIIIIIVLLLLISFILPVFMGY